MQQPHHCAAWRAHSRALGAASAARDLRAPSEYRSAAPSRVPLLRENGICEWRRRWTLAWLVVARYG
jgi:hypothetical protein